MKKWRKFIVVALASAAISGLGLEAVFKVLTEVLNAGPSPHRDLLTTIRLFNLLLVLLLAAVVLQRDDREPEEVLRSGLRWTIKFFWLYIRVVIAVMMTAMVTILVAGAVVGLFSPKDVAIYLGVPLLTGFAIGILLLVLKAYAGRRHNHPTS